MQSIKLARVGIALLVVGAMFAFVWWYSTGYVFLAWYWSYQISALTFATLMAAPSIVLSIVGLASYVAGRDAFWRSHQRRKAFLALLGLTYMFVGGFFIAWTLAFSVYGAEKLPPPYAKPLTHYLVNNSPYFILFALWFAAGLLVLADAVEAHWKGP